MAKRLMNGEREREKKGLMEFLLASYCSSSIFIIIVVKIKAFSRAKDDKMFHFRFLFLFCLARRLYYFFYKNFIQEKSQLLLSLFFHFLSFSFGSFPSGGGGSSGDIDAFFSFYFFSLRVYVYVFPGTWRVIRSFSLHLESSYFWYTFLCCHYFASSIRLSQFTQTFRNFLIQSKTIFVWVPIFFFFLLLPFFHEISMDKRKRHERKRKNCKSLS